MSVISANFQQGLLNKVSLFYSMHLMYGGLSMNYMQNSNRTHTNNITAVNSTLTFGV